MSLYYVMRPESVQTPNPVFTRVGRITRNLVSAAKLALREHGRVYETDGSSVKLIQDLYEPPELQTRPTNAHDYRIERAIAQLFTQ